ncbi:MAG: diaminopimelate epimerase [Wolinella sp.]
MYSAKYCASGNDFIIFHTFQKDERESLARELCDRHSGIGADGLIVLLPHDELDFEWEFYNSDGSRANMCGNGARAAAMYARDFALAGSRQRFLTGAGVISASVDGENVEIKLTSATIKAQNIKAFGHCWWLIDTGVPHLVAFGEIDSLKSEQLASLRWEFNANVNFAQKSDKGILVRTFERGVEGETLACGTGMAAVFMRARGEGLVRECATLIPASKEELRLRIEDEDIFFSGRVQKVCDAVLSKNLARISRRA